MFHIMMLDTVHLWVVAPRNNVYRVLKSNDKEEGKGDGACRENDDTIRYRGDVQLLSIHTALMALGTASAGSLKLNGRVICTFRRGMQQEG